MQTFKYSLVRVKIKEREKMLNENELIKLGFDEADDIDMCEACEDAIAVDRSRGYKVCRDCYVEMGV
jgi:hypothetical protein